MDISDNHNSSIPAQLKDETSIPQGTVLSSEDQTDREMLEYPSSKPISIKISDSLDSTPITITMTIATIFALFGDDIKSLSFPKSSDDVFSSIVILCLFLFTSELILSFYSNLHIDGLFISGLIYLQLFHLFLILGGFGTQLLEFLVILLKGNHLKMLEKPQELELRQLEL